MRPSLGLTDALLTIYGDFVLPSNPPQRAVQIFDSLVSSPVAIEAKSSQSFKLIQDKAQTGINLISLQFGRQREGIGETAMLIRDTLLMALVVPGRRLSFQVPEMCSLVLAMTSQIQLAALRRTGSFSALR